MQLQRSSNGQLLNFAPVTALGVGGEARIFPVPELPSLVAKVYHRPKGDHGAKLSAMLANPPEDPTGGQGHVSIAWPSELLLAPNGSGQVLGFLMPYVTGMRPIIDFYHPKTRRQQHPLFNYLYLVRTARNLAACAAALHARGYVIGDINESNILVADTALVTLVDTDSFQVPDPAHSCVYRCRVGKPEFTPRELQGLSFEQTDRRPEHDMFGLTVLLFQLLMEGTHPFAGRHFGAGEPPPLEERIAHGHFPYVRGHGPMGLPVRAAPRFDTLHPALRELFARCFVDGHADPAQRPEALAWQRALDEAEGSLATCSENDQHRYSNHLSACPWCERRQLLRGLDAFPSRQAVQEGEHLVSRSRPRPASPARPHARAAVPAQPAAVREPLARWKLVVGFSFVLLTLVAYWIWVLRLALAHR